MSSNDRNSCSSSEANNINKFTINGLIIVESPTFIVNDLTEGNEIDMYYITVMGCNVRKYESDTKME